MVQYIGVTKTYDDFGGSKPLSNGGFGNFEGDCPVFKSGRKGHTFYFNTENIFYGRGMLSRSDYVVSVAPKPKPKGKNLGSGFII